MNLGSKLDKSPQLEVHWNCQRKPKNPLAYPSLVSAIYKRRSNSSAVEQGRIASFSPSKARFAPASNSFPLLGGLYFDFRGPCFTAVETVPSAL
jgi:hypothetical protein